MRRIALLCLALPLTSCGYNTWWNPPFTGGNNPNLPTVDGDNMRRVMGQPVASQPIMTEPGDIWPGPLPPPPTLQDLEASGLTPQVQEPAPGSPNRDRMIGFPPENPAPGSSTPPQPTPQPGPPSSSMTVPSSPSGPPPAPPRTSGEILQTPQGPAVTTGGGRDYRTTIQPGGGQSIVVPNGNGTSTVIHSDGRIETIPTPK